MQLSKAIALFAASAGITDAYLVRIGYKVALIPNNFFVDEVCAPFFKVWDDNLVYAGEKEFPDLKKNCISQRKDLFCKANGCPFQVNNIAIGIRVVQDGGSDKAIRVEAWKGAKSTWTWCQRIFKTEGTATEFYWECDFRGV